MSKNKVDVIIVGAGPSGLSLSYYLQAQGISHLVLEKSKICRQWYERFDKFFMNTANWMNQLPIATVSFEDKNHLQQYPDELASGEQILCYLQQYATAVNPPLKIPCEVQALDYLQAFSWQIKTSSDLYYARHVVVCTGSAAVPKWPLVSQAIKRDVTSLHASAYRNPEQIDTKRVLVVGSGSSGVQICEDLARSNKFHEIIFSVSNNRRFPWKILGVPIHKIVRHLGLFDLPSNSRLGRWIIRQGGDRGDPATPPSPKKLSKKYGVKCVAKITAYEAGAIVASDQKKITTKDLTVIWCTGFSADKSILPDAVRDKISKTPGWPAESHGLVQGFKGLHFLGLRFQSTLSSHILYGIGRDAHRTALHISQDLQREILQG